jgi:hypothetical protein
MKWRGKGHRRLIVRLRLARAQQALHEPSEAARLAVTLAVTLGTCRCACAGQPDSNTPQEDMEAQPEPVSTA